MPTAYDRIADAYIERSDEVKRLFAPPPQPEKETPFADFYQEKKEKDGNGFLKELWEELPLSPYYWKTPAEKAEIEEREKIEKWAESMGIPAESLPKGKLDTRPVWQRTELRGAEQADKEAIKIPPMGVPSKYEAPPGERFVGEWVFLSAIPIPWAGELIKLATKPIGKLFFKTFGKTGREILTKAGELVTKKMEQGKSATQAMKEIVKEFHADERGFAKLPKRKPPVTEIKPPVEPVVPKPVAPAPVRPPTLEPPAIPVKPVKPAVKPPISPAVEVGLPVGERGVITIPSATQTQKTFVHEIARTKNLMTSAGKMKAGYRRLAEITTGKTSMSKMSEVEADAFAGALDKLVAVGTKAPPIGKVVTPTVNEIGAKELIRPAHRVFDKMGLLDTWEQAQRAQVVWNETIRKFEKNFEPVIKNIQKLGEGADEKLWTAFQSKEGLKTLTPEETTIANWVKSFYNSWAERIGLPKNKKIEYYVTHLFEESKTLDPDILRMIDMGVAKEVQIPFLKQRFGIEAGLNKSVIESVRAYNNIMLKAEALNPVLKQLNLAARNAPSIAKKYIKDYTDDIGGRILPLDTATNNSLAQLGEFLGKLPGGGIFKEYLTTGNPAQKIGGTMAQILHLSKLGARPASAIRNLSQQGLIGAEVGPVNFAEGKAMLLTKAGRALLKESVVWRSRKLAFMPGVDEPILKSLPHRVWDATMVMFKMADKDNVATAFLAGYRQATRKGLPREWAIKRGDEVARDTQYLYTKFARAMWARSGIGKAITPLTSWGINWAELMVKWAQGRPSRVFTQYEKFAGVKIQPTNWIARRKALISYAGLVSAAYFGIQKNTDIRAVEYTGWTSIQTFAAIAGGDIAGFDLPGGVMKVLAGYATDNDYLKNEGLYEIRPDRYITVIKQVSDVLKEKKDPVSLFLYTKPSNWKVREMKKTWSDDFGEYEDIEDTKTKTAELQRLDYRKAHPEIDAKMFVTGKTTTLKTPRAKTIVRELMKEHGINPEDVRGYENVFGEGARPIGELGGRTWGNVRPSLDSGSLGALNRLWYGGGQLTPSESSRLWGVHKSNPMGQPVFNTWVKQTLRQSYENSLR